MAESLNGVMFQYFHWFLPPGGRPLWEPLSNSQSSWISVSQ
jgi:hypothetical protein